MKKSLIAAVLGMLSVPNIGYTQSGQIPTPPAAPRSAASAPANTLIDINSAREAELDTLPGIGSARAAAIVKGRPYKGKNDLLDKGVLPANVYAGIKDRIVARQK
jgi:competence protein ComEA